MKAFRFPLQVVLDQRKREEELAQRDLALVLRDLQSVEDKITSHRGQIKLLLDPERAFAAELNIKQVIDRRRFVETLHLELIQFQKSLSPLQGLVDEKKKVLVRARQRHESLKKLKEKRFEEFKRETFRQEQREMDEIAAHITRRAM